MNDEQRRLIGRDYESRVVRIRGQARRCGMALSVLLFTANLGPGWPRLLGVSFFPAFRVADLFPVLSKFEKNIRFVGCFLLVG